MWELDHKESWAPRIDAFELWCWRRLLTVPWTVRRSSQSMLKEISPEYSLERLILKLKFQYFGHLMRKTDSLKRSWRWEKLKAEEKGKTEDKMVGWHHLLNGCEFEQALGVDDGQGSLVCCSPWGHKETERTVTELNWTEYCETITTILLHNSFYSKTGDFISTK